MTTTIHAGTTFFQSLDTGDVAGSDGNGLFHEDTRFVRRMQLLLDGQAGLLLTSRTREAGAALHFLTNPKLDGAERATIGVVRRHFVGDGLHADIDFENFGDDAASFVATLTFSADFAHIFTVKRAMESGAPPEIPRDLVTGFEADARALRFRLEREGLLRETHVRFGERPTEIGEGEARFRITIPRRAKWHLCIDVSLTLGRAALSPRYTCRQPRQADRSDARESRARTIRPDLPVLRTDHVVLEAAYERACEDMIALRIIGEEGCGEPTLAAGIPWYLAVFGRDSLIASYQTLLHEPTLARGTLRTLARLQGTTVDKVSGEEPGKILHEHRHSVDASARQLIPKFPYYGTIDATPLFVITLSEYVRTSGDLALAKELWPNVRRAMEWMVRWGDSDGDGLLEYELAGTVGLANQGWKDSVDSVRFRDGRIADAPIALVEVQGYACDAFHRAVEIGEALGETRELAEWRRAEETLRRQIESRYWLADRGYFAEALDGRKRPVDALTSNPGHLLWSGAVDDARAKAIAAVLLTEAMFSGYGVRTMATTEGGYNPISYHNGSVWPHDNSLIVAGLSRYGLHREAGIVVDGLLAALAEYPDRRLPELFAGYSAAQFGTPVEYPAASRPQAWASGAVILLVQSILGIQVDALRRRVRMQPLAVAGVNRLRVAGLHIGGVRAVAEMQVTEGRAHARLRGLPEGWRQD